MPDTSRTYEELTRLIASTYKNPDLGLISRAHDMAVSSHGTATRLTGEPYIVHPLAVAYKLAEMGSNLNVVAAGLLHDVIEDSTVTLEEVSAQFGDDIASLVDSLTKLKKVKYSGGDRYAENMRKMFLAMASDVRVVFIKFSDRLHNLKTLYAQPRHKQERIARESLDIYAPIAGRLGMSEFKGEIEDLCFEYLFPRDFERVRDMITSKVREKGAYVSRIIDQTEKHLAEFSISDPAVHGRVKRLYSLYKKLGKYDDDLSKIYDLIAVRVIVRDVEECYAVLGILHQKFTPMPGRIKDYLAQPKPNGYQSLHTTVYTDEGEIVEFQIRTQEMHELAEFGVAAHWRYKETGMSPLKNLYWMEELGRIQKELSGKKDFMEQLEIMKIDVFKDRIFVFTPNGDVIDLPEGATPVDFAYAIHTELGNKCSSARVNGTMRNLDTELRSNDVVEIVTDKNRRGPNPDWMKFVKTHHARSKIKDAAKSTVSAWLSSMIRRK